MSDLASVKQTVPFSACSFSRTKLDVQIGQARLDGACLQGMAASEDTQFSWNLAYRGESPPSFLLPLEFYSRGFPKAKVLTGIPLADYTGCINLNGKEISVDGWRGSQNHNWGPRHTDRYAWGQVAGFDGNLDAFLECSTARLRFGPVWTPWFTNLVLRIPGREFHLNSLTQSLRNRARYRCFDWTITSSAGPVTAIVTFTARSDMFVGLGYDDPPGGKRTCLNTKLAACSVQIIESGKQAIALSTSNRAAFEILTTTESHGLELSA